MTSPLDYNQHLLAYIQAWRQLLDASAAMTSGLPFPPGPSVMPMPPAPPMPLMTPPGSGGLGANPPTDYAQQLFAYLQTWRQYLEQAIASAPGTPAQATGSQATGSQSAASPSTGSQSTGSTGSQSSGSQSSGDTGSQSSHESSESSSIVVGPKDPWGTIGYRPVGVDLFHNPDIAGLAGPTPTSTVGTAYAAKAASVDSGGAIQAAPQSLYSSGHAADALSTGFTPSASIAQTGPDPRRAAPPPTSRWWQVGEGYEPGFTDRPAARNLKDIRPLDLGGGEQ